MCCQSFRWAIAWLFNGEKVVLECIHIHVRTKAVRSKWWTIWSDLIYTTIAETPVLMAIIEACALVTTRVYALHILSGFSVVWLIRTMIETGTSHIACWKCKNTKYNLKEQKMRFHVSDPIVLNDEIKLIDILKAWQKSGLAAPSKILKKYCVFITTLVSANTYYQSLWFVDYQFVVLLLLPIDRRNWIQKGSPGSYRIQRNPAGTIVMWEFVLSARITAPNAHSFRQHTFRNPCTLYNRHDKRQVL